MNYCFTQNHIMLSVFYISLLVSDLILHTLFLFSVSTLLSLVCAFTQLPTSFEPCFLVRFVLYFPCRVFNILLYQCLLCLFAHMLCILHGISVVLCPMDGNEFLRGREGVSHDLSWSIMTWLVYLTRPREPVDAYQ